MVTMIKSIGLYGVSHSDRTGVKGRHDPFAGIIQIKFSGPYDLSHTPCPWAGTSGRHRLTHDFCYHTLPEGILTILDRVPSKGVIVMARTWYVPLVDLRRS